MRKARLGLESIEREAERIRTLLGSPLGVAVYNDAAISIPDSSWTVLTFNSERQDDADFHSIVSNTSRLTVPIGYDGWYVIAGHINLSNVAPIVYLSIYLNNGVHIALNRYVASSIRENSITTIYHLSAGDYVELRVWQNSGGALDVNVAANYSPEFRIARLNGV